MFDASAGTKMREWEDFRIEKQFEIRVVFLMLLVVVVVVVVAARWFLQRFQRENQDRISSRDLHRKVVGIAELSFALLLASSVSS